MPEKLDLSIPEGMPAGPLRDYREWALELWTRAGKPTARKLAEALTKDPTAPNCAHTTVGRYLKGEVVDLRLAVKILERLYGNPMRSVERSQGDWDAFHAKAEKLVSDAIEARTAPADGTASGDAPVQGFVADGGRPAASKFELLTGEAVTVCAAGNDPEPWRGYGPLVDLHRLVANGGLVRHRVYEVPARALPGMASKGVLPQPLDVLFAFYHGFKDFRVEGRSFSVGSSDGRFRLNELLPPFRKGVVLIDNVPARVLSQARQADSLLDEELDEFGAHALVMLGRGRLRGVVERLHDTVTASRGVEGMDGFEILAAAARRLQGESDMFVIAGASAEVRGFLSRSSDGAETRC
ncbi:hypothetical protein AB0C77_12895 [Streptomyces sp. NPDC048629]|uniref:hypothetical protein n=1 Tax=Streptomyces sp. NPDC048629 TaxID=3154824 RepID=UPI0034149FEF